MNLFELFVKIGVDDQASGKLKDIGGKLGSGLKTAAKIGTAAVGAAAAGITALTTAAVKNYAEYEQLVGGVDTLFKDASKKVQQYAAEAYRTSGMSANDYMANATAFSASLISSLGGDTEKAAEYANRAMVSMSDNANKMGTSLDSIVQTYQSLSRGNMAMLDNLKLGYGGTKAELERLIKDAASYTDVQKEMGVTVDASSMSFDNIVNAIAVVQGKLGIAGATALEAGTTIEGSVNSMKAAWFNLVTGIADDNADFGKLMDNFVSTIAGDENGNGGVINNILPRIEKALGGVVLLIEKAVPIIIEALPGLLERIVPPLVKAAASLVDTITKVLPSLIDVIVDALIDNAPMLIVAGFELALAIIVGLIKSIPKIVKSIPTLVKEIGKAFKNSESIKEMISVGSDIIDGILKGLKNGWKKVKNWFTKSWKDLVGGVKDFLGIHSPSRLFAGIGQNMALGVGEGWEDTFGDIEDDISDSLDLSDEDYGITTSSTSISDFGGGSSAYGVGGSQNVNVTIGIDNSANAMGLARALLPFLKIAEKEVYA